MLQFDHRTRPFFPIKVSCSTATVLCEDVARCDTISITLTELLFYQLTCQLPVSSSALGLFFPPQTGPSIQ